MFLSLLLGYFSSETTDNNAPINLTFDNDSQVKESSEVNDDLVGYGENRTPDKWRTVKQLLLDTGFFFVIN